jgi:hypothetical protein
MRVMVIVKATPNSEANAPPTTELLDAMTKYNDELIQAGILLGGDGLKPSSEGKRVTKGTGKHTVTDGPFTETKELIAGYWIWQVKAMDEALEWVRRCPDPMPGEESIIEIRPLVEFEDFGEVMTDEIREREEKQRVELEKRAKA